MTLSGKVTSALEPTPLPQKIKKEKEEERNNPAYNLQLAQQD